MELDPEHIESTMKKDYTNPFYEMSARQRAHAGLDAFLDQYSNGLVRENEQLKRENEILRNERESDKETIKNLLAQVRLLTSIVGERAMNKGTEIAKHTKNKAKEFSSLIQNEDKTTILKRLHELIDGKGGKDAGAVIRKAFNDKLITRLPTEKEYKTEFTLIGAWRSISNYFNYDRQNVKEIVDNIKIL